MSFASIAKAAAAQDKQVGSQDHSPPKSTEKKASFADVLKTAKAQDTEQNGEFAGLSVTTMANVAKFAKKVPRHEYKDVLSFSDVHRTGSVYTLTVPLVLILASLLVPAYCIPLIVDGDVPGTRVLVPVGLSCILTFPMLVFLKWIGRLLMDSFDFDDDFADDSEADTESRFKCLKPSVPLMCLTFTIVFRQAHHMVDIAYADTPYIEFYQSLLNIATAMSFTIASLAGIDSTHESVEKLCRRLDSIARNKRSHACYRAMRQMGSFHDKDKDGSARIPGGHRSPPQVLADITGIYCNVAKMATVTLLVLFFLDFDLSSNLVVIGLAIIFAGIIKKLDLQNAFVNVLALSFSNAVHVGELIALGSPGGGPPDGGDHVIGYLEGCTWGHVIIRDFGRNPIYIRHEKFHGLSMSNLSRRPSMCVSFTLPVVAELSGGTDRLAKLAEYAKEWMKKHPFIDQSLTQKALLKWSGDGLVLDVMFYSTVGSSHNNTTAEFTVVLLDAAKRLKLCLMPAQIRTHAPGSTSMEGDILEAVDLSDLNPSPELTARAGCAKKPKKKHVSAKGEGDEEEEVAEEENGDGGMLDDIEG